MRRSLPLTALLAYLAASVGAQAQAPDAPAVLKTLLECRAITQSDERLACYDRSVGSFALAFDSQEVVVADREQVREAKRGLFGITLPQIKLFSRGAEDQIQEITAKIDSSGQNGQSKWVFSLDTGARWMQTDTRSVQIKPGDEVRIRQAAMGSYLANVDGQVAIRVRRVE